MLVSGVERERGKVSLDTVQDSLQFALDDMSKEPDKRASFMYSGKRIPNKDLGLLDSMNSIEASATGIRRHPVRRKHSEIPNFKLRKQRGKQRNQGKRTPLLKRMGLIALSSVPWLSWTVTQDRVLGKNDTVIETHKKTAGA